MKLKKTTTILASASTITATATETQQQQHDDDDGSDRCTDMVGGINVRVIVNGTMIDKTKDQTLMGSRSQKSCNFKEMSP